MNLKESLMDWASPFNCILQMDNSEIKTRLVLNDSINANNEVSSGTR